MNLSFVGDDDGALTQPFMTQNDHQDLHNIQNNLTNLHHPKNLTKPFSTSTNNNKNNNTNNNDAAKVNSNANINVSKSRDFTGQREPSFSFNNLNPSLQNQQNGNLSAGNQGQSNQNVQSNQFYFNNHQANQVNQANATLSNSGFSLGNLNNGNSQAQNGYVTPVFSNPTGSSNQQNVNLSSMSGMNGINGFNNNLNGIGNLSNQLNNLDISSLGNAGMGMNLNINVNNLNLGNLNAMGNMNSMGGMMGMNQFYNVPMPPPKQYWACRYCGIDDPTSVVRCLESNFWFCNSSGGTSASHIIHHLVRSKNKSICLHPNSHLGETIVECYNCSNRNLFMMGFIPATSESVVVLLCRNCLHIGAIKELGWNSESWTPLIQDRELVPWLVTVPPSPTDRFGNVTGYFGSTKITTVQINKLEDLWKTNPNAGIADLEKPGVDEEPNPVQLRYEDGYHYQRVFEPLVKFEADYDREMKEALTEDSVNLKWKHNEINHRVSAVFIFSAALSESLRITIGDELKLKLNKNLCNRTRDWECAGTVVNIDDDAEITLELRSTANVPYNFEEGYNVSFVWKPITFDRMQQAMKIFAVDDKSVSGYLYHKILGHSVEDQTIPVNIPEDFNVKGLPKLNSSQTEAIRQVLRKPLALIQGPPGTGKTVTCASLVYHLVQQNGPKELVLVTAPSNVAVDQLTQKIEATGVRVVRLAAKSREHLESNVEHLALHNIIQNLDTESSKRLKELSAKKENSDNHLSHADMKELIIIRRKLEKQALKSAQVICCTCSGAGDPRLADLKFKQVLLDEATQATEPESLIPLVMGCKQFVLVGDHCQLGPVVMCKKAANAGLNSSMFERLVCLGLRPIRLQVQYRMHPCLSEFPSNTFYEGSLQNGVTDRERLLSHVDFPWPNTEKPMMFYACMGSEEIGGTGTSYLNRTEASNCEKVVTALLRGGAKPEQIGVVTPYEGQRAYIVSQMQRSGPLRVNLYKAIEVSSVDAFQGREKDYIILSCVRSNEKQGIGFLNDPRRLNVALTRAKFGVIVLGNPRVLVKRPLWSNLLDHFQEQGLLVEGPLSSLRLCTLNIVKRKFRDQRQKLFENHAAPTFSGDVADPYGEKKHLKNIAPAVDSRYDPRYGGAKQVIAEPEKNVLHLPKNFDMNEDDMQSVVTQNAVGDENPRGQKVGKTSRTKKGKAPGAKLEAADAESLGMSQLSMSQGLTLGLSFTETQNDGIDTGLGYSFNLTQNTSGQSDILGNGLAALSNMSQLKTQLSHSKGAFITNEDDREVDVDDFANTQTMMQTQEALTQNGFRGLDDDDLDIDLNIDMLNTQAMIDADENIMTQPRLTQEMQQKSSKTRHPK